MSGNVKPIVWIPIFLTTALIAALGLIHREPIKDWFHFLSYEPSDQIQLLADSATFTDEAEQLFFRADPELIGVDAAKTLCIGADNIGCLVTGPRIYIVDFRGESATEEQLKVVTAAHEMLHMAYFRLTDEDRSEVDKLISIELSQPRNNSLFNYVNGYNDLYVRADEAHSILGTEVAELSIELEEYYGQFFRDRSIVVQAHQESKVLLQN